MKIFFAVAALSIGTLVVFRNNIYPSLYNKSSVQKGVEWLITQQDVMDPETAIYNYKKIYKVTSNKETAQELLEVIKKEESRITSETVAAREKDAKYNNWLDIEEAAVDIRNEQCSGKDTSVQVAKLKNTFVYLKKDIEAAIPLNPASVITMLYSLGKLGITDEKMFDKTIETIKEGNGNSVENIYGITHIIITGSGYYDRYLNSADFQWEIETLRNILSRYASAEKMSSIEADMLSGVVISSKLLRLNNDADIERVSQKLADMQNEDGSWGSKTEPYRERVHHTVVAVLALMDFTEDFRKTEVFCLTN